MVWIIWENNHASSFEQTLLRSFAIVEGMGLYLIHILQKGLKYFLFKKIVTCIESKFTIDLSVLHLKKVRP